MRIGTQSFFQGLQQRILTLASNLKKVSEKAASGKNFDRPSDDPAAMVSSLGLSNALSRVEQYKRNMETGKLWLNIMETVMDQVSRLADQAQKVALSVATGTQTAGAIAANDIDLLLDQALGLANTQLAGKFIFAGYRTSTVPFSKTVSGGIVTAAYNGDTNNFEVQIGPNEKITVGKNGQTVFMDSGLFDTLGRLKWAIENDDLDLIQQQADLLQGVEDGLNAQVSAIGMNQNRLQGQEQILANLSQDIQDRLSAMQNANPAEVLLELQQRQTAYEFALEASAKVSQLSLLRYLS